MPDTIGNITVPEIVPSGVFPIVPDYPYGHAWAPDVAVHQFGSGNTKIEQRFLLGTGAKRFTVRKSWLRESERVALRNFWESKYGPFGAFTYNAPNDDGNGTTAYTVRFADEPLSWEMVADYACSLGVTLIEIPLVTPAYVLNATATRFPSAGLQAALLAQAQQLIPLIKVQPLQAGYPAIYLSDRRCTVGAQLYLARLLDVDGISQGMGGEADQATFTFGNADRVMRDLTNDVDLFRASIEFSLFHVGTGAKLDFWKGDVTNWAFDAGPEFKLSASDGLYELNLPYPCRKVSRTCWKPYDDGLACPFASEGALDLVHFPSADAGSCDRNFDTPNGCLAHGMKERFGGVLVEPQGVNVKDNSTGTWGFGRSSLTSVSLVGESCYDEVVPEVYTDSDMPVNAKVAAGCDESDYYEAMGIVGEGPLGAYGSGHKLDGHYHHGYPGALGLREVRGTDPAGGSDWFSLDQSGDQTGGDWRKVFNGFSTFKDNYAAGTAFVVIRRSDAKGLQLSKLGEHQIQVVVAQGLSGWVWSAPGVCSLQVLTNPVWIVVNAMLRARGLRFANAGDAAAIGEQHFDVASAIAAAGVCDQSVTKLVGAGFETQFKFRGVLQEGKPLRDWIQEILMNCMGYYTFAFGKLKLGVSANSSAVEAFTAGNILYRSLQLEPARPSFNHLSANFADADFEFVNNSMTVYDIDHAALVGGSRPLFLKTSLNLAGTASKSQAARLVSVRLREELGGITPTEWKRARNVAFRTTVLALNVEPGMVCSMTHPDMPAGAGEFRVTSWRLNKDFSIDISGRTTTDSMYDLVSGPKPADVEATPVTVEPENPVPDDVQSIAGQPFNLTLAEDGKTATLSVEYDPPAAFGVFAGVTAHVEAPDGTGQIALSNDYWYNGNANAPAGDVARRGTFQVKLAQPVIAPATWRVYLTPRSRAYAVPLVLHGGFGESVSRTVDISKATTDGLAAPTLPTGVTIQEKPGSRRLLHTGVTAWTTWFTLQIAVAMPPPPVAGEWISLWLSRDDKATWDGGALEFPITQRNQTFEIEMQVPDAGQTWWAKVTTSTPNGYNSPAAAVESTSGAVIAALGDPAATVVKNANATAKYAKNADGVWYWGGDITLRNPTAVEEVNFWITKVYIQHVDAGGNPDPDYGIHEVVESEAVGQVVTWISDRNWAIPKATDTYRTFRYTAKVRNRAGVEVLQTTCWPGGVDHMDVTPVPQTGALDLGRAASGSLGSGLVISANQLLANIGGVLGFNGGQIQVSLGSGVQNYLGSIYAKVAQGLGFDVSGNIQIPTNGIGQGLLSNSQIIDAARLVDYAVSQMKLQNAQIINSARIVDLAVLTGKIGLLQVGAAQIADASITNAKISDLSVSKLTAGTATFTGDVTFQNTGNIYFQNGGNSITANGSIGAYAYTTRGPSYNWLISADAGNGTNIINNWTSSFVQAGLFKISGTPVLTGQTVTVIYKQSDGTTNGYLYFNGGILTSYS